MFDKINRIHRIALRREDLRESSFETHLDFNAKTPEPAKARSGKRKASNSNIQHPEKFQNPSSNPRAAVAKTR
jgi:hypothetical protein